MMTWNDNFYPLLSSFFLCTGTKFHFFEFPEKFPEFKELQNINDNGFTVVDYKFLSNLSICCHVPNDF